MKFLIKIIILTLTLSLLVSCTALYNKLSSEYGNSNLQTVPKSTSSTALPQSSTNTGNQEPAVSFSAPDFTVLDENGKEVKLSSFAGKPIVVNFWATWCIYCKQEMPDFQTAYEKYPNVQFVMVNVTDGVHETIESAKQYISKNNFSFPVFFDTMGSAEKAYPVTGYPATYFIDSNGDLVAYANGMISLENLEKGISMITGK